MNPTILRVVMAAAKNKNMIPLTHGAGTFNFGITNGTGVRWVFPDGTTSTAAQPNVVVTAGVTRAYCNNWSASNLQLNDGNTNANFKGKLSDFRGKLTYYLNLAYCSLVTGSLADLQGKITSYLGLAYCSLVTGSLADLQGKITYYLELAYCALVTGSLADLQGKITFYLSLTNCTLVTGSLADLQGKITYYLSLANCALVTGSLADLQGKLTYWLDLGGCALVTGVYTPVGTGTPTTTVLSNTGLSTADMDNTLIAYAAATKNNGSFTATGMTRSAASDAAVATLTGRGWTISGITKV